MREDRMVLYRFLGICFTYPSEGFEDVVAKSIELVNTHYSALNKSGYKITGIRNLKKGFAEMKNLKLDEWQGTYTSLFISNFPSTPLHPYESFYKEGLLVSESSDELVQIYRECGLEIFDSKEFPDSITFEMEFASFILENQDGCLPVFKQFFFEHLFSWIYNFFDDLIKYSETPLFYRALAEIGISFLKKEENLLKGA